MTAFDAQGARQFWNWFREFSPNLRANNDDPAVISEVDSRVGKLEPALTWEIGSGNSKPWQFVISPDLDPNLRDKARAIIALAPELSDWEFYSARQPKNWNYRFTLTKESPTETISVDATGWQFALLQYPNGEHEVLIEAKGLPQLSDSERWCAAAVVLESILGEEVVLEHINSFDLTADLGPELVCKAKPIRDLRDTFASVLP